MHRRFPYHSSKEICSKTELLTYTATTFIKGMIGIRNGLEGPCDNLVVEELTEEDLELCEVVCQPANVTECAKVMSGTDEEGNDIWEDDPEACVELEKTECQVHERQTEDEDQGADNEETDGEIKDEPKTRTTKNKPKLSRTSPSTTEEVKHDDSAVIFFPNE